MVTNSGQLAEVGRRVTDVARTFARGTAPNSPLNTTVSRNRRFTVASGKLEDYRNLRARYDCDVNDVVLAVIAAPCATGCCRAVSRWRRPRPCGRWRRCRCTRTPSSIRRARVRRSARSSPFLVDLPVGEGNAVVRLSQIAHMPPNRTRRRPASSTPGPSSRCRVSRHRPCTPWASGWRPRFPARQFNLLITNVPGAQKQMYIAGTKLLETYAVPPLLHNQVLAIGVTSYNGMLYFGINADRDAMSDVDVLPALLRESLDELLEAAQ